MRKEATIYAKGTYTLIEKPSGVIAQLSKEEVRALGDRATIHIKMAGMSRARLVAISELLSECGYHFIPNETKVWY